MIADFFKERPRVSICGLILLVLLLGWWMSSGRDLDEALALQGELLDPSTAERLSEAELTGQWERFEAIMTQLSEEQRAVVHAARRQARRNAYIRQLDAFFALPTAEQIAHLDREIDLEQAELRESIRQQAIEQRQAAATIAREGHAGPPPGGEGEGMGGPTDPEVIDQGARNALTHLSAEDRSKMAEYQRRLDERKAQRAIRR